MKCDLVVDLSHGDAGKAKITHELLKANKYTHCIKSGGGKNCGHTFYYNGQKIITHQIPIGVVEGVLSIIPFNCVVDVDAFLKEIEYVESFGVSCRNIIKIDYAAHITTALHLEEDSKDTKIGTTKSGIGPTYRDKYARTGLRAKDVPELKDYLIDLHEELFNTNIDPVILVEGAQGFYLDINFGDYPYVTSSHTTVAGALLNGIPHTAVRDVYGVCKGYDTYVGAKSFEPSGDANLIRFREVGNEYGSTTGRPRQCNYLNITALKKACRVNAVNKLIINKMDVLREVDQWKIISENQISDLKSEDNFINYIKKYFNDINEIIFSYSPYEI